MWTPWYNHKTQASRVAQWVKNLPAMQETQEMPVQSLSGEDPLEEDTLGELGTLFLFTLFASPLRLRFPC